MLRREMLGILGSGAAGLAALNAVAARAQEQEQGQQHEHDEHIQVIAHCAKVCNEAAQHCLSELRKAGNSHAEQHARAHEATMDCQAFCVLAASLMARSSPFTGYAHEACANACRDCAAACEGHEDKIMRECIDACRNCEKVCRQMANAKQR